MSRPHALFDALQATIVGQEDIVEGMILALMAGGHALLEILEEADGKRSLMCTFGLHL